VPQIAVKAGSEKGKSSGGGGIAARAHAQYRREAVTRRAPPVRNAFALNATASPSRCVAVFSMSRRRTVVAVSRSRASWRA